jgi:hypothetical protein
LEEEGPGAGRTASGKWRRYVAEKQSNKEEHDSIEERTGWIKNKLVKMAILIDKRDLSRAEYNKLFPEGSVKTPLGIVKMGSHQFEKLEERGRKELLGPMFQTLNDPIVILSEERGGEEAKIYLKSFKTPGDSKITSVISVVVDIEGQAVSISTGKRREKQVEEKIKLARSILYEKEGS